MNEYLNLNLQMTSIFCYQKHFLNFLNFTGLDYYLELAHNLKNGKFLLTETNLGFNGLVSKSTYLHIG